MQVLYISDTVPLVVVGCPDRIIVSYYVMCRFQFFFVISKIFCPAKNDRRDEMTTTKLNTTQLVIVIKRDAVRFDGKDKAGRNWKKNPGSRSYKRTGREVPYNGYNNIIMTGVLVGLWPQLIWLLGTNWFNWITTTTRRGEALSLKLTERIDEYYYYYYLTVL